MKKKVTVLGAGMVGRTLAIDLAKQYDVTSADISEQNLKLVRKAAKVKTAEADLSSAEEIQKVIAHADLVIGAVPGFMGFNMLKAVLNAKKTL